MNTWILLNNGEIEGIAIELKSTSMYPSSIGVGVKGNHFVFELGPKPSAKDDLHYSAQESGSFAYDLMYKEHFLNSKITAYYSVSETSDNNSIHGRSADLLFALAVLKDCLKSVTERKNEPVPIVPSIAATGVLTERNGVVWVQSVDGIQAKLRAALRVLPLGGHFFYPATNQDAIQEEIKKLEGDLREQLKNIVLCPVERLADAAQILGIPIQRIYLDQPYPGLKPMGYEQRSIFFGRELEINDVCNRLVKAEEEGKPGLLVSAASGRGKSSLIQAGVIPALEMRRLEEKSPLYLRHIIWSAWVPSNYW